MEKQTVKFMGYSITNLQLVKKTTKDLKHAGELIIGSQSHQNKKNKNMYKVVFELSTITEQSEIKLTIEGEFEFASNIDSNSIENFLKINASTVLYPYCRTIISTLTSFDSSDAVILPIINFAQFKNN